MSSKRYQDIDVMTAARDRIRKSLMMFPRYYVSFSAGKDSGVMLNLVIEEARLVNRLPVPVLFLDLEAQYKHTIDYALEMMGHPDVTPYWVALPLNLRNAVSQVQTHWQCWAPNEQDRWVRTPPAMAITDQQAFPFYRYGMEFEEFVPAFHDWFGKGEETACFVGIRSDESLNRFRTIASQSKETKDGLCWTTKVGNGYNVYPLYDWRTEDIWTANARHGWSYNKIYDLMHKAGVSIHQMRICQPYGDDQRRGLWLFKVLEPDTWSKVVARVTGANFGNRYAGGEALGNHRVVLPEGHTYKTYAKYLLSTMPPHLEAHYRKKIHRFLTYWRKHGKEQGFPVVPDKADAKLEAARKAPSWRRICKVLLKNDYWCKGLSFSQTKREIERQLDVISRWSAL